MCSVARDIARAFRDGGSGIFEERLLVDFGILAQPFALLQRAANDLVLDVGDVHHVIELKASVAQPAPKNVLECECSQIPDMDVVIDRWAAGIHADVSAVGGLKHLDLLGQSVVEAQGHVLRGVHQCSVGYMMGTTFMRVFGAFLAAVLLIVPADGAEPAGA